MDRLSSVYPWLLYEVFVSYPTFCIFFAFFPTSVIVFFFSFFEFFPAEYQCFALKCEFWCEKSR